MTMGATRIYCVAVLIFCCGIQYMKASGFTYGICDVGDLISSANGSIVASKGSDCTRIILAPRGWRIKFTIHAIFMVDASFDVHDGGSRMYTNKYRYHRRVSSFRETVHFTTSNALLLYTDRITSNDDGMKLNASFEMFKQAPGRCSCPATVNGQTVCSLPSEDDSGQFYYGRDILDRKCTTSCDDGHGVIKFASFAVSSIQMECELDEDKPNSTWAVLPRGGFSFFFPVNNLITCSKATLPVRVLYVYSFTYTNILCAGLNTSSIEAGVNEYLVRNMSASYVGECYKTILDNCTVRPILASCSAPSSNPNNSLVKLEIRDNVEVNANATLNEMKLNLLVKYFTSNLMNIVERYITNDLKVNGSTATGFQNVFLFNHKRCPDDETMPFSRDQCLTCPLHYATTIHPNYNAICAQCPSTKQRYLNETKCVNGSQVYPKHSYDNCFHTCALGKFFNKNSGLCEWCEYGTFQNSTTYLNPMCRRCPGGNTTAFVGARSEKHCMNKCQKGQVVNYPTCVNCTLGYYMPYEGNHFHKCYQCPSGNTTLNTASVNQTDCVDKCSRGEYFNISQGTCVVCLNNTYQDEVKEGNTRTCKACPLNSITLTTRSTSLSACLGPCSSGEYLDIDSRRCEQCSVNTYSDLSNHTSFMCKTCGKHKITQQKGSNNASQCIYQCNQGEFFNVTSETCEKCANNTFQDVIGKDFCKPCSGNTFTLKTGSKTCIAPCYFGQFLNKITEMCQDCRVGYYQNNTDYVLSTCSPCPMDFYTDKLGSRNCTACPNRGITVITAATVVSECIERCEPGFHLNKSVKSCQKCSKGFYQDENEYRYETCTECASANLTTLQTGATSAEQCVGYCESFPCFNGAKCTNIDNDFNCTCPSYLTGKQCQTIVDSINADRMEISVRFTDLTWNSNLSNPQNEEFVTLAKQIENSVRDEFKNDPTFRTVKVKNLKEGSVIGDPLEFTYVAGTDFGNPLDSLKTASADGKIGNLTVDSSSFEIVDYTCSTPLGMENGRIPDDGLSSANEDNDHPFTNARLHHNGPGWTPRVYKIEDAYLQVDFQEVVLLTGIATQGSSYDGGEWLQAYRFDYSVDGRTWLKYKDYKYNRSKIFPANDDIDTVVRNDLRYPVAARYVRLIREFSKRLLSYRCEFYGCPIPKDAILPTLQPPRTAYPTTAYPTTAYPTTNSTGTASTTGGRNGTVGNTDDDDDDDGSKVGLIVGLVLGLLILFIVIGVVVWYCNGRKRSHSFGAGVSAMPMKEKL